MPELPEVETVRTGLSQLLPGRIVTSVQYDWPKGFPNAFSDVARFLCGARVQAVRRRAKVLLIDFDNQYSLVIHLKMTGQLVFRGEQSFGAGHPNDSLIGELPDRSTRIIFGFDAVANAPKQPYHDATRWQYVGPQVVCPAYLYFNDQRKFGWVRLLPTIEIEQLDFFKRVGPEPLAADFTWQAFASRLRRRTKSAVKAVLLDQSVVAGVGNIYADESLWGAKIHPLKPVGDLRDDDMALLFTELQYVLRLAIEKGGSTDRNYVNAEGKRGSYMDFARVFRLEGQACPRCGTTIIKTRAAGRGTHTCPQCQVL